MKYYYPYPSDKPEKKYYIITKTGKHIYFGQASASDFTRSDQTRSAKLVEREIRSSLHRKADRLSADVKILVVKERKVETGGQAGTVHRGSERC